MYLEAIEMNGRKQNIFIKNIPVAVGALNGGMLIDSDGLSTVANLICGEEISPDGVVLCSFKTTEGIVFGAIFSNEDALEFAAVLSNAAKRGETEQ